MHSEAQVAAGSIRVISRPLYRMWRDGLSDDELDQLSSREREERAYAIAKERSLAPEKRDRAEALVGFVAVLRRFLRAQDGTVYRKGFLFPVIARFGDQAVVKLSPTKEKKPTGKPLVPTTFITLRPEWLHSTGWKVAFEAEEEDDEADCFEEEPWDELDDGCGWEERRFFGGALDAMEAGSLG